MKALIFAAGLGTRLRPLTNDRPKALVEVNGSTLLEVAIRRLVAAGCREIIINVHHFAEQVIEFIEKNERFGIQINISDERDLLLDTGGGLKKAAWFFDDGQPFLVCNADVLTDMDLAHFYQKHLESGALATLAVRHRTTSRYFLFDEKMRLCGWRNAKTGEERLVGDSPQSTVHSPQSTVRSPQSEVRSPQWVVIPQYLIPHTLKPHTSLLLSVESTPSALLFLIGCQKMRPFFPSSTCI